MPVVATKSIHFARILALSSLLSLALISWFIWNNNNNNNDHIHRTERAICIEFEVNTAK